MKSNPAIKTAVKGAKIGYIVAVSISVVFFTLSKESIEQDYELIITFCLVVVGLIGVIFGAAVGGGYAAFKGSGSTEQPETSGDPQAAKEGSTGGTRTHISPWRTAAIIAAGFVGTAVGLTLWFGLFAGWIYLPNYILTSAGMTESQLQDMPLPFLFINGAIHLLLTYVMPPVAAGLGGWAGVKLFMRLWPQPDTIPAEPE